LLLLLAVDASGRGQGLHLGLKVGVPFTVYFDTAAVSGPSGSVEYSAATRRYTAGVSAEWRAAAGLGLEFDVLYKRMGYVGIVSTASSLSAIDVKGSSWDFPLLVKRRFGRRAGPYLAGGGVLRYIGPVRGRG
jgi:hypothetical protein